jgi:tRNA (guanine37-N1)-methyltransferase
MQFNVITIFPQMIEQSLQHGVVGQAVSRDEIKIKTVNPRQFTTDTHQTVDDRPYGGGDGMVMLAEPLRQSLEYIGPSETGHRVYLSAQGEKWSDEKARSWAQTRSHVTLICGRYGGIDQRFINAYVDEEISVGDYVLSGGELAALIVIDSVARFQPNVLGNSESSKNESFANGLLESPLFTRPNELFAEKVPAVFLSGDHSRIDSARRALSLLITLEKRPDLITEIHKIELSKARDLLKGFTVQELKTCGLGDAALKYIEKK